MRQEGELVQKYESRGQRFPIFLPSNFNPPQLGSEMFPFSTRDDFCNNSF